MKRRLTDKFDPEPAPKDLSVYRERSWHTLQQVAFHLVELNGAVQQNKDDIAVLDKDVAVSKKLAWSAMVILTLAVGLAGLYLK